MAETNDKREDGVLFEDLIEQASSIGSLSIEDRELTEFEPALAAAEAAGPRPEKKTFGKRASRRRNQEAVAALKPEKPERNEPESSKEPALPQEESAAGEKRVEKAAASDISFDVISPFGTPVRGNQPKSAIELLREEREAQKRREAEEEEEKAREVLDDAIRTGAIEQEGGSAPEKSGDNPLPETVLETQTIDAAGLFQESGLAIHQPEASQNGKSNHEAAVVLEEASTGPKADDDLIFSAAGREAAREDNSGPERGKVFEPDHVVAEGAKVEHLSGGSDLIDQNDPSLTSTITSLNLMGSAAASALLEKQQEEAEVEDEEEDDEDQIFDPSASLVDDYDYDLYQDRKHFLMSDYKKMEDYLEAQARQGYHYVSHEGKKFYFHKGEPSNDYYEAMYFTKEPVESQWQLWKEEGWEFVHRTEGKKRSDYGWIIFRHPEEPGQFRRTIDNNKEKYRFFRKYANSCRSTLFLLFICLVTSVITAFLQWEFKGYLAGIILCGVVFVISLYFCIVYARMLSKSRKQAQLLKARIRRMENMKNNGVSSEEAALENDWDEIDEAEASEDEDE